MSGTLGVMALPRSVRRQIEQAVRDGRLVKPSSCEKCEATKSARQIWAHVPNEDTPLDVTWLCAPCWNATAERKPTVQPKRKQNIRKAPPYEQMKADYAAGHTFTELAKMWNISSGAAAWHLLRDRARAFGEWPLPEPPKPRIRVNVIWDLVQYELARAHADKPVWVAQKEADRFAPFCRSKHLVKGGVSRREIWPRSTVRYHQEHCYKIKPVADAFSMNREVAEDWGYVPCLMCVRGISLDEFATRNGFHKDWVYGLSMGKVTHVSFEQARRLLSSIKEPIPDSLWLPGEKERARAASLAAPRPPRP
jgi:hypothetical protein